MIELLLRLQSGLPPSAGFFADYDTPASRAIPDRLAPSGAPKIRLCRNASAKLVLDVLPMMSPGNPIEYARVQRLTGRNIGDFCITASSWRLRPSLSPSGTYFLFFLFWEICGATISKVRKDLILQGETSSPRCCSDPTST